MSRNTRKIAQQRIRILYNQALETIKNDPAQARRYIQLMKRIAQRTRTHLPTDIRRGTCRKCDTPLIPGYNSHTRTRQKREPHTATTCHNCQNITRIPLRRKKP